jgi:hypothetical protein
MMAEQTKEERSERAEMPSYDSRPRKKPMSFLKARKSKMMCRKVMAYVIASTCVRAEAPQRVTPTNVACQMPPGNLACQVCPSNMPGVSKQHARGADLDRGLREEVFHVIDVPRLQPCARAPTAAVGRRGVPRQPRGGRRGRPTCTGRLWKLWSAARLLQGAREGGRQGRGRAHVLHHGECGLEDLARAECEERRWGKLRRWVKISEKIRSYAPMGEDK